MSDLLLWTVSGAALGITGSYVVFRLRGRNVYWGVLLGAVIGGIGGPLLLIPFWVLLRRGPEDGQK
jgi:hypothetical protein